jgi:hypothetical protein
LFNLEEKFMKTRRTLLAAALVTAFALGIGAPTLAADPHQHAAGEPSKLLLDHGKKWATDEPLRKNMSEIRAALAAKQAGIHNGTLAPTRTSTLSSPNSLPAPTRCKASRRKRRVPARCKRSAP